MPKRNIKFNSKSSAKREGEENDDATATSSQSKTASPTRTKVFTSRTRKTEKAPTKQVEAPKVTAPKKDLRPKHLSTKFTKPDNTPEVDTVYFPGMTLEQHNGFRFRTDDTGFDDLVTILYNEISCSHKSFSKTVSLVMFRYYCVTLLWLRKLQVAQKEGDDLVHQATFMERKLGTMELCLPVSIHSYLSNLGSYTTMSNIRWTLDVVLPYAGNHNGITGHFGPYNTHRLQYCGYLSPYITYKMCVLEASQHLVFDMNEIGVPNHQNILGISPLVRVHPNILRVYHQSGLVTEGDLPIFRPPAMIADNQAGDHDEEDFDDEVAPVDPIEEGEPIVPRVNVALNQQLGDFVHNSDRIGRFNVDRNLLQHVSSTLSLTGHKLVTGMPVKMEGSSMQSPYIEIQDPPHGRPTLVGRGVARCHDNIDALSLSGALLFKYRYNVDLYV